MVRYYKISDGFLLENNEADYAVRVLISPTEADLSLLKTTYDIDEHTIASLIDPEEEPRFEQEDDHFIIVWKCPKNFQFSGSLSFEVTSIAILGFSDKLEVILSEDFNLIGGKISQRYNSIFEFLLGILSRTIIHFQSHLKIINMVAKELKQKINTSMDNTYLLQMFDLAESLVYYLNAISSNGIVLEKLKRNAIKIGFSPDEVELINDILIDNNQCSKKAEVLSSVMAGLMDARGTVVNNNVNSLLRRLTIINTIFLPLNLLASIGGMSEYTAFTSRWDWKLSYLAFFIVSFLIAIITYFLIEPKKLKLRKSIHRRKKWKENK